jgi:adenylate cyclase
MTAADASPAGEPRQRISAPLSVAILAAFILIVVVITTALTWVNFTETEDTAIAAAERMFNDVRASVFQQESSLFAPLVTTVTIFGEDPQLAQGKTEALLKSFLNMAELHSQIFNIYVGLQTGEHYDVFSFTHDGEAASVGAPINARFAVHTITPGTDGQNKETWRFLDEFRNEIGEREGVTDYDPRKRQWYQQARAATGEAVKTPPYLFVDPPAVGLTFAKAFYGFKDGVVAVDMTMDRMSEFLRQFKTDARRTIFTFDDAGMLTAHGTPEKVTQRREGAAGAEVVQAGIADLKNPAADAMFALFKERGPYDMARITVEGVDYLTTVATLPGTMGNTEYLAFAVPSDEFMKSFTDAARQSVLWAMVIVLAFVPVIVWISRRISRPLRILSQEAESIRRFELTEPVKIRSQIWEIQNLAQSIGSMKNALNQVSKFVPKTLVQDLIRSGASMDVGGERRRLSLLLTDVKDFTPLSEALTPEDLMTQMSEYFDGLVRLILQHNGTVDKFVGDAIFAYWNAPVLQDNHEILACDTALACRAASNAMNAVWRDQGRAPWQTRFGVHAGDAVVGNVGSSDRVDYTAIGNAVNIGARLEGLNKFYGTQILVSEPVKARTGDRFLFRYLDRVKPKGAVYPLDVYELIGTREGADELRVIPMQERLCRAWDETYRSYAARDWHAALDVFEAFAAAHPYDKVARIYLERIITFIVEPPPADWDGVTRFTQK